MSQEREAKGPGGGEVEGRGGEVRVGEETKDKSLCLSLPPPPPPPPPPRHNPTLSAELVQVRKHFESARERFLIPLCKEG